jgi:DNA-binding transcriptional LysR family regulator
MDPHLRALRCFVAAAEEQHFTRAAARLHLAQPALSKHVRALETLVRTPLFTRGRYGARLTAAGTALLPHAQQLLAAWDSGRAALEQAVQTEHRQLVVGLRSSVGRGLLRRTAVSFQQQHPQWRVRTRQYSFADPFAGLLPLADEPTTTDVALLWLPLPAHDALTTQILLSEPRLIALPAEHPLARLDQVPFDALLDEPFLALPASTGPQRSFWLADELRNGRPARIGAVVYGPEEVVEALAAGTGVAFISAGNAELHRSPVFVTRPVPGVPPADLAVVWRKADPRPAIRDYVHACHTAATDGSPSSTTPCDDPRATILTPHALLDVPHTVTP